MSFEQLEIKFTKSHVFKTFLLRIIFLYFHHNFRNVLENLLVTNEKIGMSVQKVAVLHSSQDQRLSMCLFNHIVVIW